MLVPTVMVIVYFLFHCNDNIFGVVSTSVRQQRKHLTYGMYHVFGSIKILCKMLHVQDCTQSSAVKRCFAGGVHCVESAKDETCEGRCHTNSSVLNVVVSGF